MEEEAGHRQREDRRRGSCGQTPARLHAAQEDRDLRDEDARWRQSGKHERGDDEGPSVGRRARETAS